LKEQVRCWDRHANHAPGPRCHVAHPMQVKGWQSEL